jgi:hypothetical protein
MNLLCENTIQFFLNEIKWQSHGRRCRRGAVSKDSTQALSPIPMGAAAACGTRGCGRDSEAALGLLVGAGNC